MDYIYKTAFIDGKPYGEATNINCGECGGGMTLKKSSYGLFYSCKNWKPISGCKGTHGAHPDGKPLGIPTDRETKDLRIKVHGLFDDLWKDDGDMTRFEAYSWLQDAMGLTKDEAHIGNFNKDQCTRLIKVLEATSGTR